MSTGRLPVGLEASIVNTFFPEGSEDEMECKNRVVSLFLCVDCSILTREPCRRKPSDPPSPACFNLEAPPHAFPSPYPPICASDPFPISAVKRGFLTPWLRNSGSSGNLRRNLVEISELTVAFAQLSLGSNEAAEARPFRPNPAHHSSRAFLGFVTPCARAPHPALVRKARHTSCSEGFAKAPHLRCQSPRRRLHPSLDGDLSTEAQKRSIYQIGASNAYRTIKRTLPRRTPKNPPNHHPLADASSPIGIPRPSLNYSPSRSISSNSSASGSDVDSPLATPRPSPRVLPSEQITVESTKAIADFPLLLDSLLHNPMNPFPQRGISVEGTSVLSPSTVMMIYHTP